MTARKTTSRTAASQKTGGQLFDRILIANRGEIACRIIRTAKRLGIETVAVYSEADADSLHVREADEAVFIGLPAPAESYLRIEKIVAAAKSTGAQAVHPGFGFLSERAAFCKALEAEGIVFIGPGADAIDAMGDKIRSKQLAEKAKVNTVPGFLGAVEDPAEAVKIARAIGYPVMVKASAGGGGKGMRIALDDTGLKEGLKSAASEAKSSFGDARVFIEKYIEQPRHIEIQVLADSHGNTVYLGERECSIQRRHQKVVEEAPSVFLDEETREAMGTQAVRLAQAVNYKSAGTVEFIVDAKRNFYFLEMNTRLQVEHPVTELITGIDLVEEMIRVAAGEKLRFAQSDIELRGWAIEARVYAEDPTRNFMPSIGRLTRYRPPAGEGVRVDTGVDEGAEISMFYDPMIAKLVTYGADRKTATREMRAALDGFYIRGVTHNINFLNALVSHPRFAEGRLSTDFIADEFPDGFDPAVVSSEDQNLLPVVAAIVHRCQVDRDAALSGQMPGHEMRIFDDWVVVSNGAIRPVRVERLGSGEFAAIVDGQKHRARLDWRSNDPVIQVEMEGRNLIVQVERDGVRYRLTHGGKSLDALVLRADTAPLHAVMPEKKKADLSRFILSPMPGLLVSVAVGPGQEVKAGDAVAVVEAMKMENVLRAVQDGVVAKIHATPGGSVAVDQPIVEFEQTPVGKQGAKAAAK